LKPELKWDWQTSKFLTSNQLTEQSSYMIVLYKIKTLLNIVTNNNKSLIFLIRFPFPTAVQSCHR
jgi:hypothetical protein